MPGLRLSQAPFQVVDRVGELTAVLERLRAAGSSVGLVPTMGALHDGHRSLVRRAAQECDRIVVSIFVNPLQFGDAGDLEAYPRTLQRDLRTCQQEGVAVAFAPPPAEMYPAGPAGVRTTVSVATVGEGFEGKDRPGHFDGVATVVAKLLAITGPCRAYFGEKDFQQLAVVRQMVKDLSFPAEIVGCPTVREPDGLACSSRNARLSPAQRSAAAVLWRALDAGRQVVGSGVRRPAEVTAAMADVVGAEPLAELDYGAVVDPVTLKVPPELGAGETWRLLIAARLGDVRLIDNTPVTSPPRSRDTSPPRGRDSSVLTAPGERKGAG